MTAPAHILVDVRTGHLCAIDDAGDAVAERRRPPTESRPEWIGKLLVMVYMTGIERLEFLEGGLVQVRDAREFFRSAVGPY